MLLSSLSIVPSCCIPRLFSLPIMPSTPDLITDSGYNSFHALHPSICSSDLQGVYRTQPQTVKSLRSGDDGACMDDNGNYEGSLHGEAEAVIRCPKLHYDFCASSYTQSLSPCRFLTISMA